MLVDVSSLLRRLVFGPIFNLPQLVDVATVVNLACAVTQHSTKRDIVGIGGIVWWRRRHV